MFKEIEGRCAILVSGGVYRVAPLYEMDRMLFANIGGGYVALRSNGTSSKDKLRIHKLIHEGGLWVGDFGYLYTRTSVGRKKLERIGCFEIEGPDV